MEGKIESFEILESHCTNEVKIEFDSSKFEIAKRDKKQPQYPKTYEECCDVLKIEYPYFRTEEDGISASTYKNKLFGALKQLLICRDAYWQMAGEQMGLSKPWCANWDWDTAEVKFTIAECTNEVVKSADMCNKRILAFPTEEMRNAFFDNFKELIAQCKELL